MDSILGSASNLMLGLQGRLSTPASSRGVSEAEIAALKAHDSGKAGGTFDEAAARKAADKFESLLIHSMLKSMRKTTMSEDKSNQRAIYDDMLDEQLAETMIKSGGIGISDQIVAQIREQQGKLLSADSSTDDISRLRELAQHLQRPASDDEQGRRIDNSSSSASQAEASMASVKSRRTQFADGLWGNQQFSGLSETQRDFVQPLLPHARHSAQRLGTSTNAILAIAALETGWGRFMIKDENGASSNNLFGIKATVSDNRYATSLTTEYIGGAPQKLQARFKTYESSADAVSGFADFIQSNPRYSNALRHSGDPERFLVELQKAGYATDPRYAEKAISIMRQISGHSVPL